MPATYWKTWVLGDIFNLIHSCGLSAKFNQRGCSAGLLDIELWRPKHNGKNKIFLDLVPSHHLDLVVGDSNPESNQLGTKLIIFELSDQATEILVNKSSYYTWIC